MSVEEGQPTGRHETELANAVLACREEFAAKFATYGYSWAILRVPSLVDRVWTKAARIRRLEELESRAVEPRIPEDVEAEYRGVVNYSVMLLDRLDHEGLTAPALDPLPQTGGQRLSEQWQPTGPSHRRLANCLNVKTTTTTAHGSQCVSRRSQTKS
ncbi:DUF1599 domain-containing protein [Plantibacter sp. M259]|uniref:DUF1599 domain-containing protein n=1 Tax=Plantibacter sp. M259 TaxID=2583822 RepID=UPI001110AB6F